MTDEGMSIYNAEKWLWENHIYDTPPAPPIELEDWNNDDTGRQEET